MGSHWDAVVGQDLPDTGSCCSHRTVVVKKPGIGRSFVRLFPRNCILKMLQSASVNSVIYCLALGNKFVFLALGNKFLCLALGNKFIFLALQNKFVCLALGNKFICLALGNKFVMHQTLHTKEGDQHCCNFD